MLAAMVTTFALLHLVSECLGYLRVFSFVCEMNRNCRLHLLSYFYHSLPIDKI